MRTAIYAGSFDPVTLGHVDMIVRGAALFDRLVVAVGHNEKKRAMLDAETRRALITQAVSGLHNVDVTVFCGLLVDHAREVGADIILRGIRPLGDFELEFRNGMANRAMSGMETLFLLADPKHVFVSSSLVREIAAHGGDVGAYVAPEVEAALRSVLA